MFFLFLLLSYILLFVISIALMNKKCDSRFHTYSSRRKRIDHAVCVIKTTHLAFVVHRTNRQAIRFPLLDLTKNDSNNSFSRSPYCQSAFSSNVILNFVLLVSSGFRSYEHSGGRNANFAATGAHFSSTKRKENEILVQ